MSTWPPGVTLRPIGAWPRERTTSPGYAPFRATWSSTLTLLNRELRQINATDPVLQIDLRERDFRIDGMPRADARPTTAAVILSFTARKVGALSYPCDAFIDWQDNVRAIVLSLEALRKVDRYGVTKRGEQYTGWKALEDKTTAPPALTPTDALAVIAGHAGLHVKDIDVRSVASLSQAVRYAQRNTHPDHGGDPAAFQAVTAAKAALDVALDGLGGAS